MSVEAAFVLLDKASGPLKEIRRQAALTDKALRGMGQGGSASGFGAASSKVQSFSRDMEDARKVTKTLGDEVDKTSKKVEKAGGFFRAVAARVDALKKSLKSASPAVVDFSTALGGVLGGVKGILTAFPPMVLAIAAAAPVVVALTGAVLALGSSLAAAVGGGVLLGGGLLGSFAVGLGSIAAIAKPAITATENYQKAVKNLNTALASGSPTEIKARQQQLDAIAKANPGVQKLAGSLKGFSSEWKKATAPARADFFKLAADGIQTLRGLMPTLASEANKNTGALQKSFKKILAPFLDSSQFKGFISGLGGIFQANLPGFMQGLVNVFKGLADILKVLAPQLDRAGPSFQKFTGSFAKWAGSAGGKSTVKEMGRAFTAWLDLVKQIGRIIGDVIGAGTKPGTSEVTKWADNLTKAADSLKKPAAQNSMAGFMSRSLDDVNKLWPVLKSIATDLTGIYKVWSPLGAITQSVIKAVPAWAVAALSVAYVGGKGVGGAVSAGKSVLGFFGKRDGSSARKALYVTGGGGGGGSGGGDSPLNKVEKAVNDWRKTVGGSAAAAAARAAVTKLAPGAGALTVAAVLTALGKVAQNKISHGKGISPGSSPDVPLPNAPGGDKGFSLPGIGHVGGKGAQIVDEILAAVSGGKGPDMFTWAKTHQGAAAPATLPTLTGKATKKFVAAFRDAGRFAASALATGLKEQGKPQAAAVNLTNDLLKTMGQLPKGAKKSGDQMASHIMDSLSLINTQGVATNQTTTDLLLGQFTDLRKKSGPKFDGIKNDAITAFQDMQSGVVPTGNATATAMYQAFKAMGINANQLASALGIKPIKLTLTPIQKAVTKLNVGKEAAMARNQATGGRLPGPARGDHLPLMSRGGSLLGIADGGELVVNRHTEARQDAINRSVGAPPLGSLVGGETRKHFAQGGRLPRFSTGGVVAQVNSFFSKAGFDKTAIAGILGNAWQESGGNPNTPGGGMWQQISNFGSGTGGSLMNQMETMLSQIGGLRGALNAAGSPGAAAAIFEQGFEKAGIPAMANRVRYAQEAFAGQLGAGLTGGAGGAGGGGIIPQIARAIIGGPAGGAQALAQGGADWGRKRINAYLAAHAPAGGVGGPGPTSGPSGTTVFKGVVMADWVAAALRHAASKGVNSQPTSGFRTEAHSAALGFPHDEHTFPGPYPHGAVDFGGMFDPPAYPKKMAVVNATRDFKWPLLAPIGFHDDGHASGTGHALGGRLPWFAQGGDFVANRPTVIGVGDAPGGERVTVTPKGQGRIGNQGLYVEIHNIQVNRKGDVQKIVDEEMSLLAASIERRL